MIADKILKGITDSNAALNVDRNLPLAKEFKNLFAALIVLRLEAEPSLRDLLVESAKEGDSIVQAAPRLTTFVDLLQDIC